MSKLFLPLVLVASVFYGIADAKCKGPIRCSQGTQTLGNEPNFVIYRGANGASYSAELVESVSDECIIVIYSEGSIQAFGKGDPSVHYSAPGTCSLIEGKVFCACNDAHYCNLDLNRWYAAASELYGSEVPRADTPAQYKGPQKC